MLQNSKMGRGIKATFSTARENLNNIKELCEALGISEEAFKENAKLLNKATSQIVKDEKKVLEEAKDQQIEDFRATVENATLNFYQAIVELNPLPGGQFSIYGLVGEDGTISVWSKSKPKNLQTPVWYSPEYGSTTETPKDFKRRYNKKNS